MNRFLIDNFLNGTINYKCKVQQLLYTTAKNNHLFLIIFFHKKIWLLDSKDMISLSRLVFFDLML